MTSATHDARATLLRGLIDDAALFPPASLALSAALEGYHEHRHGRYRAIAGRFVLPARLVDEIMTVFDTRRGGLELSVIADFDAIDANIAALRRLIDALPQFTIGAVEMRIPAGASPADLSRATAALQEFIGSETVEIYAELPFDGDWAMPYADFTKLLLAARASTGDDALGAKVRCGGTAASAFPSPDQLASAILALRDARLAWKGTAGLHHPVRGRSGEFTMHGFLNVLAAALLADARAIGDDAIPGVLAEADAGAFAIDERHFGWRDHVLDAETIATGRDRSMRSYGSCSFDEPVEDLRRMGVVQ